MRVTEAGGAQLLARRAGQRQSGTFTQQHRPRVHAAIDTTNAGTATTKPHQAQPPPEMTATTPADAGRHRRRRAGRKSAALRCASSGRPVNCLTHGAVATWIAPSSRPTTAPAPTQSDLSNNRITHDEAAAPPPARHVAIRARAAGRRRRTGDDDHEQGGDTTATSKRRAGGGTYRKGGEATATTEGGAPRRRRPWMIGRAWRRRRGEQGGRPRAAAPRPCPPRDHALAASPLARGA